MVDSRRALGRSVDAGRTGRIADLAQPCDGAKRIRTADLLGAIQKHAPDAKRRERLRRALRRLWQRDPRRRLIIIVRNLHTLISRRLDAEWTFHTIDVLALLAVVENDQ